MDDSKGQKSESWINYAGFGFSFDEQGLELITIFKRSSFEFLKPLAFLLKKCNSLPMAHQCSYKPYCICYWSQAITESTLHIRMSNIEHRMRTFCWPSMTFLLSNCPISRTSVTHLRSHLSSSFLERKWFKLGKQILAFKEIKQQKRSRTQLWREYVNLLFWSTLIIWPFIWMLYRRWMYEAQSRNLQQIPRLTATSDLMECIVTLRNWKAAQILIWFVVDHFL